MYFLLVEPIALCTGQPYRVLCWRRQVSFPPPGQWFVPTHFCFAPAILFPFSPPWLPTCLPLCYVRPLMNNSWRETLVFTELCYYCYIFTRNNIQIPEELGGAFLWCINSAVWYSSSADEYDLVLVLLGRETHGLPPSSLQILCCQHVFKCLKCTGCTRCPLYLRGIVHLHAVLHLESFSALSLEERGVSSFQMSWNAEYVPECYV